MNSEKPSILLVRFSSIGDIILTTPVIRALRIRWPDSRISFLVKDVFAPLLRGNPHLDEVISFPSSGGFPELRKMSQSLSRRNFSLFADLHNSLRSRYLRSRVHSEDIIVYTKHVLKRMLLIYLRMNFYGTSIPSVPERYLKPFGKFGVRLDGGPCKLFPGEEDRALALEKIRSVRPAGMRLLAVAPGAAWLTKRWPPAGFAAAASELASRYNMKVILLGSSEDSAACGAVERALNGRVKRVNLAGKLPLMATAAAVAESGLLLTNDTGLMHMAAAVDTPVVSVFGCTTRHLGYFPYRAPKARVVETGLYCRPCTHNGRRCCPLGHFRCMKDISPEKVVEAGEGLLDTG